MLTDSSTEIVRSLSDAINEKNVFLAPMTNTYLWELYKNSIVDNLLSKDGLLNNNLSLTETDHDLVQDKVIEVLSNSLINQINFLKTEVVPIVDSLYEKTKDLLKSSLDSDGIASIQIVQKDLHDALKDPAIRNDIDKFRNIAPTKLPNFSISFSNITDELINRIKLAASEYYQGNTSAAGDYIHQITVDKLKGTLTNLPYPIDHIHHHEVVEDALTRYFINETLRNNEDLAADVIDNQGLSDLRKKLDTIRTYLAPVLSKNVELVEQREKATYGVVVIRIDRPNDIIYVNGPVYRKFLEQGGSVETVLGVALDKDASVNDYSFNSLLTNKEKYSTYYKEYVSLVHSRNEMNLYNDFCDYFKTIFYADRNNYGEREEKYLKLNPGIHEEVNRRLDKMLSTLRLDDVRGSKALYSTISRLVAKSRFYYTGVYELMHYMEEEYKEGDDVAQVATVAMIYYLVDYFFDQIIVK